MRFFKTAFFLFFIFGSVSQLEAPRRSGRFLYYSMNNWDTSPYKSYRFTNKGASWEWINFRLLFPVDYDSTAQGRKGVSCNYYAARGRGVGADVVE